MQYTIRNIPKMLDRVIRARAKREGSSINEVAIEALMRAFGVEAVVAPSRNLNDVAGTWVDDPAVDGALEVQRQVDAELWT